MAVRVGMCVALLSGAAVVSLPAHASGTSPYLPLNLTPDIERKVEQVLILGDQAVQTRPIPVSRILTALPKACQRDEKLCEQVRRYLDRYFRTFAVTHAAGEVAASDGSGSQCRQSCTPGSASLQLPNQHGERIDSVWDASVEASYRPYDHLLFTAGGLGFGGPGGRFDPEGTMVSTGDQYLQFDAGYRDQWLSPMTDSSMLVSTEAPTMPSLTVSSQMPFSPLGFEYQLSIARMSYQDQIAWATFNKQGQVVSSYTAGDPNLATLHLGIAPFAGWSVAANVALQYGGGIRPSSLTGVFDYLLQRTALSSSPAATNSRFANREVSFTSTYTFPAVTPLETYVEYDGRDTLHGELYRWHDTALAAGIHIPELYQRFDLTLEAREWQNNWYTDYVWLSGMVNEGSVIGDWGAAWRDFSDAAGGRSFMAQLGFSLHSGDLIDLQLRLLQNAGYASVCQVDCGAPLRSYSHAQMLSVEYAQPRDGYTRGLSLDAGRDEYAAGFVRLGAFVRLDGGRDASAQDDEDEDNADDDSAAQSSNPKTWAGFERYVSLGASTGRLGLDLGGFSPRTGCPQAPGCASEAAPQQYRNELSPHLAVGLRRPVSTYLDAGVQAEFDDFDGLMMALRVLDLRYRAGTHVAFGGFVGAARYSGPTPAQGLYYGYGVQWRNLWHHWDLSLERRYFYGLQRDKVLPSDAPALQNPQLPGYGDPVEWYTMQATSLTIAHDF
jgi:Capsule assembly protein Wzi